MKEDREIRDAHALALRMGFVGTADALREVFGKSACCLSVSTDSLGEEKSADDNHQSIAAVGNQAV